MSKRVGIYIHIPFCMRKCLYCDFCSFEGSTEAIRASYTDAICRELESYASHLKDYEVDTVYIGGGTPSCLSVSQTEKILSALKQTVVLTPDVEITSEVNPATADIEKLRAWHRLGINRLSIGVQSFDNACLKALGRLHTAEEAEDFIASAREAGFENISLDFMYGIPNQTKEIFKETLRRAVALSPNHISAYSLKIEEGTPFERMRATLSLPDEDAETELYEMCAEILAKAGYRHYEISNYAKAGYESRHNLRYWKMEEYIGVGVAAYSYFSGHRFGCDRDLEAYLLRDFSLHPHIFEEPCERELETVMLGLRLADGIDEVAFRRQFGYGFWEKYGVKLSRYIPCGLVLHDESTTCLTEQGMYVSLGILAELFDD